MPIRNKRGQLIFDGKLGFSVEELDLREAVLEGVVLQGAPFGGRQPGKSKPAGKRLLWGDFFRTNLTQADLEGAEYDDATIFPRISTRRRPKWS